MIRKQTYSCGELNPGYYSVYQDALGVLYYSGNSHGFCHAIRIMNPQNVKDVFGGYKIRKDIWVDPAGNIRHEKA